MNERILTNLALLSIERELSYNLDFDCAVDIFSNMKNRRKRL